MLGFEEFTPTPPDDTSLLAHILPPVLSVGFSEAPASRSPSSQTATAPTGSSNIFDDAVDQFNHQQQQQKQQQRNEGLPSKARKSVYKSATSSSSPSRSRRYSPPKSHTDPKQKISDHRSATAPERSTPPEREQREIHYTLHITDPSSQSMSDRLRRFVRA